MHSRLSSFPRASDLGLYGLSPDTSRRSRHQRADSRSRAGSREYPGGPFRWLEHELGLWLHRYLQPGVSHWRSALLHFLGLAEDGNTIFTYPGPQPQAGIQAEENSASSWVFDWLTSQAHPLIGFDRERGLIIPVAGSIPLGFRRLAGNTQALSPKWGLAQVTE